MWLAIAHTVRFGPSSSPCIEAVVSTANTTSTWRLLPLVYDGTTFTGVKPVSSGGGGVVSARCNSAAVTRGPRASVDIPNVATMRWRVDLCEYHAPNHVVPPA